MTKDKAGKSVAHSRYDLRRVTRTLYDIQDMRKRIEGRLGFTSTTKMVEIVDEETGQVEKYRDWVRKKKNIGDGTNLVAPIERGVYEDLRNILEFVFERERELTKKQKEVIDTSFPFGKKLLEYPGIDYKLAGVILSEIDIDRATTVSKIWRFAGCDPTCRSKKGEKNKYNKFLKTKLVGCFGHMSIVMGKTHPMRSFYEARKFRLEHSEKKITHKKKEVAWKDAPRWRRNNAAVTYAVKMWIATWLYPEWRAFEGLPVRPPYSEEYLGKKHSYDGSTSVKTEPVKAKRGRRKLGKSGVPKSGLSSKREIDRMAAKESD